MNHRDQKEKIRKNLVRLNRDLSIEGGFLAHFVENNIFNDEIVEIITAKSISYEKNSAFWMNIQKRGPRAWDIIIKALLDTNQIDLADLLDPKLARKIYKTIRRNEDYPLGELRDSDAEFSSKVNEYVYGRISSPTINVRIDDFVNINPNIEEEKEYNMEKRTVIIIDNVRDSHDGSMLDDAFTLLGCKLKICPSKKDINHTLNNLTSVLRNSTSVIVVVKAIEAEDGFSLSDENDEVMTFRNLYERFSVGTLQNIPKAFIFFLLPKENGDASVTNITGQVRNLTINQRQPVSDTLTHIPDNSMLTYHKITFPEKWNKKHGSIFSRVLTAGLVTYFYEQPLQFIIEKVINEVNNAKGKLSYSHGNNMVDGPGQNEDDFFVKTKLNKDFYVFGNKP